MRPYGPTLPTRRWPVWLRYVATATLVGLVLLLQSALPEVAQFPFLFYLSVVILCAVLFGHGSSLLATGLAGGALALFAIKPQYAFRGAGAPDWIGWAVFVVVALANGGLIELLHKALDDLRLANDALSVAEREKDLLLREYAHRTRNDLMRLLGLIKMEEAAARDNPRLQERLHAIGDRIHVFSRLQERLGRAEGSAVVEMRDYLTDLCQDVHSSLAGVRPVEVAAQVDDRAMPESTAVVVGLIANELVTNALKHAFPDNRPGRVSVIFRNRERECMLCVEDDGVGIGSEAPANGSGLGQKLVRSLASQLRGTYELRARRDGSGSIATVRFPVQ